jgi:hypothetical protein
MKGFAISEELAPFFPYASVSKPAEASAEPSASATSASVPQPTEESESVSVPPVCNHTIPFLIADNFSIPLAEITHSGKRNLHFEEFETSAGSFYVIECDSEDSDDLMYEALEDYLDGNYALSSFVPEALWRFNPSIPLVAWKALADSNFEKENHVAIKQLLCQNGLSYFRFLEYICNIDGFAHFMGWVNKSCLYCPVCMCDVYTQVYCDE